MKRNKPKKMKHDTVAGNLPRCLGTAVALLGFLRGTLLAAMPPPSAPALHTLPAKQTAPASTKAKITMDHYSIYALDIANTKQAFTVYLNGWFIDAHGSGPQGYFSSQLVGKYIADGQNTVSIHINAPAHGKPPLDRFRVHLRNSEGSVFVYDWEPDNPKHPLPVETQGHFQAHLPHGPWAWQTAPKTTLDAPTKTAINAFVKRLFDALNTKNVDEATALFAPRAKDDAVSRNLSVTESEKGVRDEWIKTFAKPGWRMDPIDYAHLNYTLFAENRAVEVTRADDTYVLRDNVGKPEDAHDSFDIFLCQVKGQWVLVR